MELEINDSSINSFIIEGLSRETPLIDIFVLLIKQLKGIKKITISHDPINYNSSDCQCQVDFLNHEYLSMAKSTLKSPNLLNNLFNESDKKIKIKECKKLRNNLIDETINKTTALMFENVQIDHTNILEFIYRLKEYINNNNINNDDGDNDNSHYKISKIRQYNNRLLILFDYVPNCIKKLVRKGENEYSQEEIPYYNYNGKNIPIIPKMKPIANIGKYKERNVKISVHCLNEEDKEQILKIFENLSEKNENINMESSEIEEMAQKAYNNVVSREKNLKEEKMKKNTMMKKREREKEKNNEREKDKERSRDKERNRERDKDRKKDKDRERKRDKEREYDKRSQKERDDNSHERKMDNLNNNININNNVIRDDKSNGNNNMMNNNNNINNINGLNINEKDLNQVASLFSNANAMNIVKYLLENNMFNNISNNSNNNNNNSINNNSNIIPKKDNYNENFNNMYNQNNLNNMNNQQLMNLLQSQGNMMNKQNNQQQRMNNMYGNNMGNNFQNMMNLNNMMNMDNNMLNANFYNNQRQFPFPMNEQFMNQFAGYNKRKDNNK